MSSHHGDNPAALRRRKNVRTVATIAVIVALVILGLALGGDDEENKPSSGPRQTPQPEAACDAEAPPEADPRQYDSPPPQVLKEGVDYAAEIDTSCGMITIDLLEQRAPKTVNNFVFLARKGFFDGLIFHRVEQNAVIETGDPEPDPVAADPGAQGEDDNLDGPGYSIEDELPEGNEAYVYGTVAMSNQGPGTGGSKFFIVVHDPPNPNDTDDGFEKAGLRPDYSIFGKVLIDGEAPDPEGRADPALERIATAEMLMGNDPRVATRPAVPIYVNSIEIMED